MPKPSVMGYLVALGLLDAGEPVRIRVPSKDPAPNGWPMWHVPEGCTVGVRSKKVTMAAGDIVTSTSGPRWRAVLCDCLRLSPRTAAALSDDDRAALRWLVDLETHVECKRLLRSALTAAGVLRTLLRDVPDASTAVIDTEVGRRAAAARKHLSRLPNDADYQFWLAQRLVSGHRDLTRRLRHGDRPRGLVRIVHEADPDTVTALAADPSTIACVEEWEHRAPGTYGPIQADTLTQLGKVQVWMRCSRPVSPDLLGCADVVVTEPDSYLMRIPLLAGTAGTGRGDFLTIDRGYPAEAVISAEHLTDAYPMPADLLAAVTVARS